MAYREAGNSMQNLPAIDMVPGSNAAESTVTHATLASMMGVATRTAKKLVFSGIVSNPVTRDEAEALRDRQELVVTDGVLPVLRTDAATYARDDSGRETIGFHVDQSDHELSEACLGYWNADGDRIVEAGVLLVTVATVPVALFDIAGIRSDSRPGKVGFNGELIARLRRADTSNPLAQKGEATRVKLYVVRGDERRWARDVMSTRVWTTSGGPIAYLEDSEG